MKKKNHAKVLKKYSNKTGPANWGRDAWADEVIRLAKYRYNLEIADLEKYIERHKGEK